MTQHITVLKDEAIASLNLNSDSVVVDATLGSAGHTTAILEVLGEKGTLIALDADEVAITAAQELLQDVAAKVEYVCTNFRTLGQVLQDLEITEVDAVLADLGWRMDQFTEGGKGFSFNSEDPLVMTYGDPNRHSFTAADIVNEWPEEDIRNVLKGYGEERFARRIAGGIVQAREEAPISTAQQLAEIVSASAPAFYRNGKTHPATKTFQALRIAVNDELEALEVFIKAAVQHLAPGGRLSIITFHSIEDRIVKHLFRQYKDEGRGSLATKKPIRASDAELKQNPRARSAQLRTFIKHT